MGDSEPTAKSTEETAKVKPETPDSSNHLKDTTTTNSIPLTNSDLEETKNLETVFKNPEPMNSSTEKMITNESNKLAELNSKPVENQILSESKAETDISQKPLEKSPLKNRSDMLSLHDTTRTSSASTIFSVAGVPARNRPYYKKELPKNNIIPTKESEQVTATTITTPMPVLESIDTLRSGCSTSSNMSRNPVTGFGVNSNDEYKGMSKKRKDGNPVLGLGYDDHTAPDQSTRNQRIPPGGRSNGLW